MPSHAFSRLRTPPHAFPRLPPPPPTFSHLLTPSHTISTPPLINQVFKDEIALYTREGLPIPDVNPPDNAEVCATWPHTPPRGHTHRRLRAAATVRARVCASTLLTALFCVSSLHPQVCAIFDQKNLGAFQLLDSQLRVAKPSDSAFCREMHTNHTPNQFFGGKATGDDHRGEQMLTALKLTMDEAFVVHHFAASVVYANISPDLPQDPHISPYLPISRVVLPPPPLPRPIISHPLSPPLILPRAPAATPRSISSTRTTTSSPTASRPRCASQRSHSSLTSSAPSPPFTTRRPRARAAHASPRRPRYLAARASRRSERPSLMSCASSCASYRCEISPPVSTFLARSPIQLAS